MDEIQVIILIKLVKLQYIRSGSFIFSFAYIGACQISVKCQYVNINSWSDAFGRDIFGLIYII